MNGLELSRSFFEEYGRPMLEESFPELMPLLAVGLVGSGSERFGFDDEISRDHDFEPGFCMFLPTEDRLDRRSEFLLERAYSKLPKEYEGIKRLRMSPVGGNRNGVMRTADFYSGKTGFPDGGLSTEAWLTIPDEALAEAVNGEVFYDGYGEFTAIRNRIKNMPEDIRLKRIAGNLLLMGQSGQYNYSRCLKHGEHEAAQLACGEFVNSALKVFFLLSGSYKPYYKWSFRALRQLDGGEELADKLSFILQWNRMNEAADERKLEMIEEASMQTVEKLVSCGITDSRSLELEEQAYLLNNRIADSSLRNLHILAAV